MSFILPELPYAYEALEPYLDKQTMEIHHQKHHATYTNNLNTALQKYPEFLTKTIEEILTNLNAIPEEIRVAVQNNGGGYYHHNLWWAELSPNAALEPHGKVAEAIQKEFGSFSSLKEQMTAAALNRFGSGWAWLSKRSNRTLLIHSTPNQDSPLSQGLIPLLGIDVWEHAYYLKYQNRRKDFVDAFWNVINWDEVEQRFLQDLPIA